MRGTTPITRRGLKRQGGMATTTTSDQNDNEGTARTTTRGTATTRGMAVRGVEDDNDDERQQRRQGEAMRRDNR